MASVRRGEIKRLLILESLPKPINYTGGMDPLSYGGTFTLERIVCTVPVEEDGSARSELPALRAFVFIAQDEAGYAVKRMQSFASVMPEEKSGCVGCHEPRTQAAPNAAGRRTPKAPTRPLSRPGPVSGMPDVLDFPRDVQPILDELCVRCHGYDRDPPVPPPARLLLSGDRGPMFSHRYYAMTVARLFSDGRNDPRSDYAPRTLGSSASRILKMLDGSHHGVRTSPRQEAILRYWIDTGAPYPGTYAALGSVSIGGYAENRQVVTDFDWPVTQAARAAIERRCLSCHQGSARQLRTALADERGVSFWRPDWNDPRLSTSRHIVFNLSRPRKSTVLLAPLSREAGGWGICRASNGTAAIFRGADDADYLAILGIIEAGRRKLGEIGRFDMPGFRPPRPYLREMRRYGVLSPDHPDDGPVNPHELDRRYRSLFDWPPRVGG